MYTLYYTRHNGYFLLFRSRLIRSVENFCLASEKCHEHYVQMSFLLVSNSVYSITGCKMIAYFINNEYSIAINVRQKCSQCAKFYMVMVSTGARCHMQSSVSGLRPSNFHVMIKRDIFNTFFFFLSHYVNAYLLLL